MPRPSRREDVLRVASSRFFRDGIHATGVDRIIADAGVAKMTLYGNFRSKDDLVVAYLRDRDRRFWEDLDAEVARRNEPLERALAPVAVYRRYLDETGFHGCAFVNAGAELPPDHPGRALAREHKQAVLARWAELVAPLGMEEPLNEARGCFLVLEGAFVQLGLGLDDGLLDDAERLIRERLAPAGHVHRQP